jgi:hypothetical protein
MQISFSWMQISLSRMQISFSRPTAGCKLHPASGYPVKIPNLSIVCMRLGTNRMIFASGWPPTGCKILQKYAASTLLSGYYFASMLGLHFYKL